MAYRPIPQPERQLFNQRVWQFVRQVPEGKVVSYGQVARWAGIPDGVTEDEFRAYGGRWAGGAMAGCPADVPWQRVLNSQGKISLPGANGALQRQLLESEGVEFDERGKIDLRQFGWEGPALNDLAAKNLSFW